MQRLAEDVWRGALDLVYPRTCAICGGEVGREGVHLCWECLSSLPLVTPPFCSLCGDPVEGLVEHSYRCSWCRRHAPAFDRARSAVRHRGGFRRALHAFKYQHAVWLRVDFLPILEACVATHFRDTVPDAVTFVPLYSSRERHRTYNQAGTLAHGLSWRLRIPFASGLLRRVRATASQTDLSAAERRRNVRGAFKAVCPAWIEGRTFLLVDDVMTTGATVNECARTLKEAGAVGVYVVTLARG
jgi:ComF family protein